MSDYEEIARLLRDQRELQKRVQQNLDDIIRLLEMKEFRRQKENGKDKQTDVA